MRMRNNLLILFLVIFAATTARAETPPHYYILQVVDTVTAKAGVQTQIIVTIANPVETPVTVDVSISGDPEFELDPSSTRMSFDSAHGRIAKIDFYSTASGSFQTTIKVTDGTITDSAVITVIVNPANFVLLPPLTVAYADVGVARQVAVRVQNLTTGALQISPSLSGDAEFSYNGPSSITVPASGAETVSLDFFSSQTGGFQTNLIVTDGTYTDTSLVNISVIDKDYHWVDHPSVYDITEAGLTRNTLIFLRNTASAPVTLDLEVHGDPGFYLDSLSTQITVENMTTFYLHYYGEVPGVYSGVLTITDGVDTDSVRLTMNVRPRRGNFEFVTDRMTIYATAIDPDTSSIGIRNLSDSPLSLQAYVVGDSRFEVVPSQNFAIQGRQTFPLKVRFKGAAAGFYRATLVVTDGNTEVDSLDIGAQVGPPRLGNDAFMLETPILIKRLELKAEPGEAVTDSFSIFNLSNGQLTAQLRVNGDSCFFIDDSVLVIDSGKVATVPVTFVNPPIGRGGAHLIVEALGFRDNIYLYGSTVPRSDYDGVKVMNDLNFGAVDTSVIYCLDALFINTTGHPVTVTDIRLAGDSSRYALPSNSDLTIAAGDTAGITVCYYPEVSQQYDYETLRFTVNNSTGSPTSRALFINLSAISVYDSYRVWDSTRIVATTMRTIFAPIHSSTDRTITLQNRLPVPLSLDMWTRGGSENMTCLTTSPISVPAYDSLVAGSGQAQITFRYAPTEGPPESAPDNSIGESAHFNFNHNDSLATADFNIVIYGKPLTPTPSSSAIKLFHHSSFAPFVGLGALREDDIITLRFINNLDESVTITDLSMDVSGYAELAAGGTALPATLEPNDILEVRLRITRDVQAFTMTDLIMHGSHEHINSRYVLLSGSPVSGIAPIPSHETALRVYTTPNPASGPVHILLERPLRQGSVHVVDLLGRVVATLSVRGENTLWNGLNATGRRVPPATYILLVAGIDEQGRQVRAVQKFIMQ